jgi:hypothetical protein
MTRNEDLAWAAGFFDGEGCVSATPSSPTKQGVTRCYLRASVTQKHPPLLEKFAGLFGCGAIRSESRRTMHQFQVNGRQAFGVMDALWPWLGEQKKSDFKRALRRIRESRELAAAMILQDERECGAADCTTVFTPDVRHANANFCSGVCAARHARHLNYVLPTPKPCKGCGCDIDDRTRGCRRCMTRHWQRKSNRKEGGYHGSLQNQG